MKPHTETARLPPTELRPAMPRTASSSSLQAQSEDRIATAGYIAEMAAALAELARAQGFRALGHTLDISRMEAETLARSRGARARAVGRPTTSTTASPESGASR
jgi:hypothetical protein